MSDLLSLADREPVRVADVLERAADLLEPEGAWVQWRLGYDADGEVIPTAEHIKRAVCFCAGGAIWRAADVPYIENDAVVWQAFSAVTSTANWKSSLGPWNDAPGRTQAEVVATLREAALRVRARPTSADGGE